jgi:hypothetical protein
MKKSLFTAIFTLLFLFSAPAASLAHGFDNEEFTAYLEDVGVSEKDLAEHLMYWWEGTTFYDFTDVSELAESLLNLTLLAKSWTSFLKNGSACLQATYCFTTRFTWLSMSLSH